MRYFLTVLAIILLVSIPQALLSETLYENDTLVLSKIEYKGADMIRYDGDMTPFNIMQLGIQLAINRDIQIINIKSSGGAAQSYPSMLGLYTVRPDLVFLVKDKEYCLSSCAYGVSIFNGLALEKGSLFGFHMPFVSGIKTTDKISDIIQSNNFAVLNYAEIWTNTGYSFSLFKIINDRTSPDSFLVFDDAPDLYAWRGIGNQYPENHNNYRIMSSEDINNHTGIEGDNKEE